MAAPRGSIPGDPGGVMLICVGTYCQRGSRGIYAFDLDPATGALAGRGTVPAADPSCLAWSPAERILYAVHELPGRAGELGAYRLDPASGRLAHLATHPVDGALPCHLVIDHRRRRVITANYGDGTHTVLPLADDGLPQPWCQQVANRGHCGPGQAGPHAHGTTLSPDGFAYACDLGLDRVVIRAWDPEGLLVEVGHLDLSAGSGPRQLVLHPGLPVAYVINELDSTIAVLARDPAGGLHPVQIVPTLPVGWSGANAAAHLALSRDGRFLYGSNRGHHSLAAFAVDPATGRLDPIGHSPSGGDWPRWFACLEDGLVLVANERSDTVVAFRSGSDGLPRPTGAVTQVPAPTCILPIG